MSVVWWALVGALVQGASSPDDQPVALGQSSALNLKIELAQRQRSRFRNYQEATYTLTERKQGTDRTLWKVSLNEAPQGHWISPKGNVWVLTRWLVDDRQLPRLWTRDRQGQE